MRIALSMEPNRVGVSFPSPEDRNISSDLEFQMMDKSINPVVLKN
jgi:hypothetical protein